MKKPRGRVKNASQFVISDLVGIKVSKFLAFREPSEPKNSAEIIAIIPENGSFWHRFFLDAGLGFWEELASKRIDDDFDECECVNLLESLNLKERVLLGARCVIDPQNQNLSLFEFVFER